VKTYCDSMCDVRSQIHGSSVFLCIFICGSQICKYPDKTKRRKLKLSSDEHVGSQTATLEENVSDEDDDDVWSRAPIPDVDIPAHATGGWMTSYRQGDANRALNAMPGSSGIHTRPGTKRSGSAPNGDNAKRSKVAQALPPALGKLSIISQSRSMLTIRLD
jgi:hypothetical protein